MLLVLTLLLAACGSAPRTPAAPSRTDQTAAPNSPALAPPAPLLSSAPLPSDRTTHGAAALPQAAAVAASGTGLEGGPPAIPVAEPSPPPPIALETGLYRCELKRRVTVRRVATDRQSIVINWLGKDTNLQSVQSNSGALRFENAGLGLVWIVIASKSMLLDSRIGKTLANDCRL